MVAMVRTQVSLTEDQMSRLRQCSRQRGVSVASCVREAVDKLLSEEQHEADIQRALATIGQFRSAPNNIAQDHDAYLDEIY